MIQIEQAKWYQVMRKPYCVTCGKMFKGEWTSLDYDVEVATCVEDGVLEASACNARICQKCADDHYIWSICGHCHVLFASQDQICPICESKGRW
jgi:hypothetical protein